MMRALIVLVLAVGAFCIDHECPDPNMEYTECSSVCPNTCENRSALSCQACKAGCRCKEGYTLLSRNSTKCVATCPENKKCPEPNQVYSDCNTACPNRCDDDFDDDEIRMCMALCIPGCACKPGTMLESKNSTKCVETCPPKKCAKHMEYTECVGCPQSCDDPEPKMCKIKCIPGCTCKKGYVRESEKSEKCICQTKCEHKCPDKNKEYNSCGSACPKACDTPKDQMCTYQCVPGCFCKEGYLLKSVNSTECVNNCPSNSNG